MSVFRLPLYIAVCSVLMATGILTTPAWGQVRADAPVHSPGNWVSELSAQESYQPPVLTPGHYFVENYSQRAYNAGTQNWGFAQDPSGLLYIANRNGVLEFDGATWRLIPIRNNVPTRSVSIGHEGTIYIGGVGEFGYLRADSLRQYRYVSLSESVDTLITDVWETHATRNGVYFVTRQAVYYHTSDTLHVYRSERRLLRSHRIGDRIYLQAIGEGILEFTDGRPRVLPGTERTANLGITHILAAPAQVYGSEVLLFINPNTNVWLYRYTTQELLQLHEGILPGFQQPPSTYTVTALRNGNLAFATLTQGVVITDSRFRRIHHIDRTRGLRLNMAYSVFEDYSGSLWVGLNNGLSRIDVPDYVTFWRENEQIQGTVMDIVLHQQRLYAATSMGIYQIDSAKGSAFNLLGDRIVSTTSLHSVTLNSGRSWLLATAVDGITYMRGSALEQIIQGTVVHLTQSRLNANRFFYGMRNGWGVFELEEVSAGRLRVALQHEFIDPPFEVRSFAETAAGVMFLGSRFNGVFQVEFTQPQLDQPLTDLRKVVRELDDESGLPDGYADVRLFGEEVYALTESGLYRWDAAALRFTANFPLGQTLKGLDLIDISVADAHRTLWVALRNNILSVSSTDESEPVLSDKYLAFGDFQIHTIYADGDIVWAGGPDGLYRIQSDQKPDSTHVFKALIRKIDVGRDVLLYGGAAAEALQIQLPYRNATLSIAFAAPGFFWGNHMVYSTRMDGLEEDWTDFGNVTYRDFTNLSNGVYTFRVRARNSYGAVSQEAVLTVIVATPWFKTAWALGAYVLLFAGIVWGIATLRTRSVRQRNDELKVIIGQHTGQLQIEKRRLENINEDLKAQDEHRDKFLSVVAHDLRNPLMIIRSSSELIREEVDSKTDVLVLSGYVHDAAIRMEGIIEQLLENRARKVRSELGDASDVNVSVLTVRLCEENRPWLESKQQQLLSDIEPECMVTGDAAQIGVILSNLISNAIKYSELGKSIQVTVKSVTGAVLFRVKDEGPGLTAADMRDMGTPFKRLSAQPTAGESSSGMGLSIVKDLCQAQHARLNFVSDGPGEGATFEVYFNALPE